MKKPVQINPKSSEILEHHPLFILGQSLENTKKVKVTYTKAETAASVYSMLHLSTMFGENYKKISYGID